MEQISSFEANFPSATQEMSHIICKLKVHYYVYKSSPLSRPKPEDSSSDLKIRFFGCHLSMFRSSKLSLAFRISDSNFVVISRLFHASYMFCPSHPVTV
jgi:hypothetical protein